MITLTRVVPIRARDLGEKGGERMTHAQRMESVLEAVVRSHCVFLRLVPGFGLSRFMTRMRRRDIHQRTRQSWSYRNMTEWQLQSYMASRSHCQTIETANTAKKGFEGTTSGSIKYA